MGHILGLLSHLTVGQDQGPRWTCHTPPSAGARKVVCHRMEPPPHKEVLLATSIVTSQRQMVAGPLDSRVCATGCLSFLTALAGQPKRARGPSLKHTLAPGLGINMVLLGAGPLCALRAKRRPVPTSVKPGDQPEDTGLGPPQNLSWSQSVNACMSEKWNHRQPRSLHVGSCFLLI